MLTVQVFHFLKKVVGYGPPKENYSLVFFKDFDHAISLILYRTAYVFFQITFFNSYLCSFIKFQLLIYTFFLAKQTEQQKEQRYTVQSVFAMIRCYKDKKLLVGNSAITEVNELKTIYVTLFKFTFQIFQMQIFNIYNLEVAKLDLLLK